MIETNLPEQFSDLEQFAAWCLSTERERNTLRHESSMEEIHSFYDALIPRLEEIFNYLDKFDVNALAEPEQALLNMTLSVAEISNAVEVFRTQPGVIDGFPIERVVFVENAKNKIDV